MHATSVRRGRLPWRAMVARAALAFLIAVIPTSVQQAGASSSPASVGSGHADGGVVVSAIGNWPDPM